jgi:endonuclease/exonuclease/phosphatase family metal-dependent hydrolase
MSFCCISYNVLADSYINPSWYPATPAQCIDPATRHPALVQAVASMNVDAMALQEVEVDVFERLKQKLLPMGYEGRYEGKGRGKADGCAVFVRRSSGTVTAWQRLDYDDATAPGLVSGHLAQLATIAWQGRSLTVANTHLKWAPDDTPREQHRGARQLDELVRLVKATRSDGWLICGDFNCSSDSQVLATLKNAGFRDAHAGDQSPTCNANRQPRKLDHIFISEALLASASPILPIDADTPLPSKDQPSDHLPVEVSLDWR